MPLQAQAEHTRASQQAAPVASDNWGWRLHTGQGARSWELLCSLPADCTLRAWEAAAVGHGVQLEADHGADPMPAALCCLSSTPCPLKSFLLCLHTTFLPG